MANKKPKWEYIIIVSEGFFHRQSKVYLSEWFSLRSIWKKHKLVQLFEGNDSKERAVSWANKNYPKLDLVVE